MFATKNHCSICVSVNLHIFRILYVYKRYSIADSTKKYCYTFSDPGTSFLINRHHVVFMKTVYKERIQTPYLWISICLQTLLDSSQYSKVLLHIFWSGDFFTDKHTSCSVQDDCLSGKNTDIILLNFDMSTNVIR